MDTILIISAIGSWIVIIFLAISVLVVGRAHGELSKYVQEIDYRGQKGIEGKHLIGQPAPAFRLAALEQKKRISLSEYIGSPTLLIFMSPTCHHCHAILQKLNPIYEVWQENGGKFLGISNGDPEAMQEIARDLNVSFPIVIEEQWAITQLYHVPGTPYGVVLDAQGVIIAAEVLGTMEQITDLLSKVVPHFQRQLQTTHR